MGMLPVHCSTETPYTSFCETTRASEGRQGKFSAHHGDWKEVEGNGPMGKETEGLWELRTADN
jgi:hypothetical protein